MALKCVMCYGLHKHEEDRCPKMLPCLHTFCVSRLKEMSRNGYITCTVCYALHKIPDGGVEIFPTNQFMRTQNAWQRNRGIFALPLSTESLLRENNDPGTCDVHGKPLVVFSYSVMDSSQRKQCADCLTPPDQDSPDVVTVTGKTSHILPRNQANDRVGTEGHVLHLGTNPTLLGSASGNGGHGLHPDSIPTLPHAKGYEKDELVLQSAYLETIQFRQPQIQNNGVANRNGTNTQNIELNTDNQVQNGKYNPQGQFCGCVGFVICFPFLASIAIVIFLVAIPIGFIGSLCYETYLIVTDLSRWNRSRSRETFTAPFFNWTADLTERFCCFKHCNKWISYCWQILGRIVDVIIWALDFLVLCCVCTVLVLIFLFFCPLIVCVFCIYRGFSNSSQ